LSEKSVDREILIEGGEVQEVGYRAFIMAQLDGYRFAKFSVRNIGKNKVQILVGGEEDKVGEFCKFFDSPEGKPQFAQVTKVTINRHNSSIPTWEEFIKHELPLFQTQQTSKMLQAGLELQRSVNKLPEKTIDALFDSVRKLLAPK